MIEIPIWLLIVGIPALIGLVCWLLVTLFNGGAAEAIGRSLW